MPSLSRCSIDIMQKFHIHQYRQSNNQLVMFYLLFYLPNTTSLQYNHKILVKYTNIFIYTCIAKQQVVVRASANKQMEWRGTMYVLAAWIHLSNFALARCVPLVLQANTCGGTEAIRPLLLYVRNNVRNKGDRWVRFHFSYCLENIGINSKFCTQT